MRSIQKGGNMFIGKITYREYGKIQKIEVKQDNVFKLLEIISHFDGLDIIEVLINKEVI